MELLIALVIGIPMFALGLVGTRRSTAKRHRHIASGAHLLPFDDALSPTLLAHRLMQADPALYGLDAVERTLLEAERLHLQHEVARLQAEVPAPPADPEPLVTTDARFMIGFKPDEPTTLDGIVGQPHIVRVFKAAIAALTPTERVPGHVLLTGLPGRGKTLLAKVLGHALQQRARTLGLAPVAFFETFGSNITSVEDLDDIVREIQTAGGGVWFIDELHALSHELSTKVFALMEDGKYPFHGSVAAVKLPPVMLIGATTDYGKMHPAFKRRFGEPHMVRPLAAQELRSILLAGQFPIDDDAADLLLTRTHWSGAPYEALVLRREAKTFALARQGDRITALDVQDVFETYQIDHLGLRWMDREILRALFKFPRFRSGGTEFVCYAASERDLCNTAGIHADEYRETIKPRLLSRRLLEIRNGYGQALTAHGASLYESLKAA